MGCDGGTIPTRDELVRLKKKPEQKDKNAERAFRWRHCAISQETLVKPIVACELGRLYNKETILEFLIDKSKFEEVASQFDHLRGLKDIKELILTDNPEVRQRGAEKGDGAFIDTAKSEYICPVVGIEMSGKYRFCFIWTCGCVTSERAIKEVKSDVCHKCGKTYKDEDVILMNGSEPEIEDLRTRMVQRRAAAKAARKGKKSGKHKSSEAADDVVFKKPFLMNGSSSSPSTSKPCDTPSTSRDDPSRSVDKTKTSKLANGKDRRPEHSKGSKLLSQDKSSDSSNGKLVNKSKLSIQDNPCNSKTYKSLFTSHASEKLQEKPHWITFNPQYF